MATTTNQQFPAQLAVSALNQTHPEYDMCLPTWQDISTLFRGGYALESSLPRYLRQRPKELPEVYSIRQKNFSYTNLMNNIIGWYDAALWQQPPTFDLSNQTEEIQAFQQRFQRDCTRSGVSLQSFFEAVVESMLMYRYAYVLIDLPNVGQPRSYGEQLEMGALNPFLISYKPENIINWQDDEAGKLQWAVVYMRENTGGFGTGRQVSECWYYYDSSVVAKYERVVPSGEVTPPKDAFATLAPGYPRDHAMTKFGQMPLYRWSVPDGLWFGNKIKLPLLNHFNLDNALDFGLFQSCLAQLVIKGRYENSNEDGHPTNSEVGYHQLAADGDMFFLEPDGKSFAITQERLDNLEERIYKACYLLDQARTNKSTPTAQSGISKAQDKTPARDALSGIGDILRPALERILSDAYRVANIPATVNVRGFDFDDKALDRIELLDAASVIKVNSPLYEREIAKQVVETMLPDASPDLLQKIFAEIDKNPTPQEQSVEQQQQMKLMQAQKFAASIDKAAA